LPRSDTTGWSLVLTLNEQRCPPLRHTAEASLVPRHSEGEIGSLWRDHRGGRDVRLLTLAEAAKHLAACTAMVDELVAPAELAPVRELNAARARREDLDALAARITRKGGGQIEHSVASQLYGTLGRVRRRKDVSARRQHGTIASPSGSAEGIGSRRL